MDSKSLRTLKEVAEQVGRPAHRIIHLCETGVVCPAVDAHGRGTVRRFRRDDVFRIYLALELQEAGVQVPLIKPLMEALDQLMELKKIKAARKQFFLDLVGVIGMVGNQEQPVLAWLTPPDRVALVTPRFQYPARRTILIDLHTSIDQLISRGVSIVANLTRVASSL